MKIPREKIKYLREKYNIQIQEQHLEIIAKAINDKGSKFLIFGVGNDSKFWLDINKNGRTVFIEDSKEWLDRVMEMNSDIEVYLVKYPYDINMADELLNQPEKLMIKLPKEIKKIKFDVILVDGPCGVENRSPDRKQPPGRMMSIYTASQLVKEGGHVFVHDTCRRVEQIYSDKYLKETNLVFKTNGFRHYTIKNDM